MAKKRWHKIPWVRFVGFTLIMVVLQAAGAFVFPDRWTGADTPLLIVGTSVLAGAISTGVMWLLERRGRRDSA